MNKYNAKGYKVGSIIMHNGPSNTWYIITHIDNEFVEGIDEDGRAFCVHTEELDTWWRSTHSICPGIQDVLDFLKGKKMED